MKQLKCEEKNCSYNTNLFCIKKAIAIDADSTCISYEKRHNSISNTANYEFASEFFSGNGPSPHIYCNDQECIHNFNKECSASSVNIDRKAFRSVRCISFRPKD